MIWGTCPWCGVEQRPHREGCEAADTCPKEEADWAEVADLRAEAERDVKRFLAMVQEQAADLARLRLTDAEREAVRTAIAMLEGVEDLSAEAAAKEDLALRGLHSILARLGGTP